ncbi:AAA family ATPase [Sphingomonas hankyongi]|uniref:Pilus assembly protein CpaE n=1 Tax=Sphingomonas hankyongi TaxID=2908209 RepID=A0ABT0S3I3_9SPHN|nr:pilus assembly protein CpaE [Sphingomonas hankyongi]MCL6730189.1 pilus assembly protein CpaE [Sphingomonas hankyongi]
MQLFLSGVEGDAASLVDARVAGFPLSLNIVPASDWIDPNDVLDAAAAVVQVDLDTPASMKRFQELADAVTTPLIAAAYEPPLALVRSLVRAGAHDVVPLPLSMDELETSLGPIRTELGKRERAAVARNAKLVSVIKSVGGVGATALMTQLAVRFAANEKKRGREACLIDLDVQFGDIAFQLGLQPRLTLVDLLEAGKRLDGDLLRATTTEHASGLKVIAAPSDMMPLEGLSADHILQIVDFATREFGTVFVDLPSNWTNWSLSLVARSDLVLLVTELTVAGVNQAKRQLNLLKSQELDNVEVRVVINRYDKAMARSVRPSDVREALGRDIAYTISNDFTLMRAAIDRGVAIDEIKRKTALAKDLDTLDAGVAAALGLER